MEKIEIEAKGYLYPMPVTLVGANVGGRPNYLAVAYCGMLNSQPPVIAIGLHKAHYTVVGIRESGSFSVNLPSTTMVKATDYCGLVSGRRIDKSGLFETFYGKLGTAPMIAECPLNLECKLLQSIDLGNDEAFLGEIVGVYTEERYLTDGRPDMLKLDPMLFSVYDRNYWRVGEHLAKAFEVGKGYRQASPTAE